MINENVLINDNKFFTLRREKSSMLYAWAYKELQKQKRKEKNFGIPKSC